MNWIHCFHIGAPLQPRFGKQISFAHIMVGKRAGEVKKQISSSWAAGWKEAFPSSAKIKLALSATLDGYDAEVLEK